MSTYRELQYDGNISKVRGIQFHVMSPEEIVKRSVVEILPTGSGPYSGNEPVANGLFDPRMGVMDNGKYCLTCGQKREFCPGHFGHLVLARPVFYAQFFGAVKRILQCVCYHCSSILVSPDSPQVKAILARKCSRQKRFEYLVSLSQKVKSCHCCGYKKPDRMMKLEQTYRIRLEWRDNENTTTRVLDLNAGDVLRIFQRIPEADAEILGFCRKFNRPEWLICTVLPIPPPAVRPSVRMDTGQRSEDDLTHILSDIIRFNDQLKKRIEKGAPYEVISQYETLLQYHVATLVNNSVPTMSATSKDRNGRQLRTIVSRLKNKEGRIRGNLMGKRVDFSARTVITPDPNLSIDELGVPVQIAMNLTFPEIVNERNIEEMKTLVARGPDVARSTY